MKRIASVVLTCIATLSVLSCATVDTVEFFRQFNYQNRTRLVIGETSESETIKLFGEPWTKSTVGEFSRTEGEFSRWDYIYQAPKRGIRVLSLEFKDERLNAYVYVSTIPEDATDFDFDFDKGKLIDEQRSTKTDVLALIGEPFGKAICPSMISSYRQLCNMGSEVWYWYSSGPAASLRKTGIWYHEIAIAFDENGVVSGVHSERGHE